MKKKSAGKEAKAKCRFFNSLRKRKKKKQFEKNVEKKERAIFKKKKQPGQAQ